MTASEPTGGFHQGPIRTTWRLMGPRAKVLSLGIGLRLIQAVFVALPAVVVVWVIDRVRDDSLTNQGAWRAVIAVGVGLVGQYLFLYASNYFAWVSTFEAIGEARIRILGHLQKLPIGTIGETRTGDVSATVTSDIEMVSLFAHHSMPMLFGGAALPAVVFTALAFIDLLLAGAVALSVVVAIPLFIWTNRTFQSLAVQRADQLAEANTRIIEYVQGISVARAFNATGSRNELFGKAVSDVRRVNDRLAVRLVPIGLLTMGVLQLGIPIVIAAVSYWWFGGRIDAGTSIVFFVLVLRVYTPLLQLGMQFEPLRLADAALERIGRLMDLRPQDAPAETVVEPADASIRFEHVNFGYVAEVPVLSDVSFEARQGTTSAIVGPSGSGKSTILNLVTRFWDPDSGSVSIGGVDVRELSPDVVFDSITTVFQDVYLFQGTIRDNIGFGRADASDEEIFAAAKTARAHEFVSNLADGYDTRIGEGGSTLSGGERQRISIARAILKDAPVILLDEATASMDPINEQAVQAGLAGLIEGRTLIVVAHRLSTIKSADQILVLDSQEGGPGRIVQRGTHEELINAGGLYRHLWAERERASQWRIGEARGAAV